MNDLEAAVLYDGKVTLPVKGRGYTVKPLPLRYIANGEFEKSGLVFPRDKNDLGRHQAFNLTDEHRRIALDKWMQKLLFYNGEPVSLKQACEWEWDVVDVGRFLDLVVQISE